MNAHKACLSVLLLTAIAQGAGSISGTVADPSGAQSGAKGEFAFPDLKPGRYSLDVEHPGFRKFTNNSIRIGAQAVNLGEVERAAVSPRSKEKSRRCNHAAAAGGSRYDAREAAEKSGASTPVPFMFIDVH
jgi:hypothetical protein